MASSFLEIGHEAQLRWQELVAGDKPWIRIGTALCGEAAGAFEVHGILCIGDCGIERPYIGTSVLC